jgi:hypothetical protein
MSGAAALMRLAQLPAQGQQKEDATTAAGEAGAPKVWWCGGGFAGLGAANLILVTPNALCRRYKVKAGYKVALLDAECSMPQSNQPHHSRQKRQQHRRMCEGRLVAVLRTFLLY